MERIAVTGANGFVGRHVVSRAAAAGYEVVGIVRSEAAAKVVRAAGGHPVELRRARPRGSRPCPRRLSGRRPPRPDRGGAGWPDLRGGQRRLHRARARGGPPRGRARASSTSPAWASPATAWLAAARTSYFLSKLAAETILFRSGIEGVVFRPSFVVGPGDAFVPAVLRAMEAGEVERPGDGSYRMQPIAVEDAAAVRPGRDRAPGGRVPRPSSTWWGPSPSRTRSFSSGSPGWRAAQGRPADLRVREVPVAEADRRARAGGYQGMLPDELDCLLCDEVADPAPARGAPRPPARASRRGPGRGRPGGVSVPASCTGAPPAEADVAVVGSGLPALAAALELSRRGAKVTVLGAAARRGAAPRPRPRPARPGTAVRAGGAGDRPRRRPGSSGRRGARTTCACRALLEEARRDCGYAPRGSFLLARDRAEAEELAESEDLLRDDGFPGEFLDHYMLETRFDLSGFPGAYWAAEDAEIDGPLLLGALGERGARAPASSSEPRAGPRAPGRDSGVVVETEEGTRARGGGRRRHRRPGLGPRPGAPTAAAPRRPGPPARPAAGGGVLPAAVRTADGRIAWQRGAGSLLLAATGADRRAVAGERSRTSPRGIPVRDGLAPPLGRAGRGVRATGCPVVGRLPGRPLAVACGFGAPVSRPRLRRRALDGRRRCCSGTDPTPEPLRATRAPVATSV